MFIIYFYLHFLFDYLQKSKYSLNNIRESFDKHQLFVENLQFEYSSMKNSDDTKNNKVERITDINNLSVYEMKRSMDHGFSLYVIPAKVLVIF